MRGNFKDMYNYETTNKSFLDLYTKLSNMGIKNKDYLLLNNKDLVEVDPWDEGLSEHEKAEIIQECEENIWYFLREVIKLPFDILSKTNPKFNINIGVFSIIFLWLNGFNQMAIMPSSMFKTGTICALYVYLKYIFGLSLANINIKDKTHERAKTTKNMITKYMVPDYIKSGIDRGNKEKHILLDNFVNIPNNDKIWDKVKNKDNIVILTTAGDMATDSGKFAFTLKDKGTKWNIKYVDKKKEYLEKIYNMTETPLFSVEYTPSQIGTTTSHALRKKIENANKSIDNDTLDRRVDLVWK